MNILFVHEVLGNFGGAESNLLATATELRARGHRVGLLAQECSGKGEEAWEALFGGDLYWLRGGAARAAPVVIVEGLSLLHDARLAERFDDSIFVDVPADVRLARRIRRDAAHRTIDLAETLRFCETFVRPMHERFIQPSAARARKVWRPLEERGYPRQLLQELRNV